MSVTPFIPTVGPWGVPALPERLPISRAPVGRPRPRLHASVPSLLPRLASGCLHLLFPLWQLVPPIAGHPRVPLHLAVCSPLVLSFHVSFPFPPHAAGNTFQVATDFSLTVAVTGSNVASTLASPWTSTSDYLVPQRLPHHTSTTIFRHAQPLATDRVARSHGLEPVQKASSLAPLRTSSPNGRSKGHQWRRLPEGIPVVHLQCDRRPSLCGLLRDGSLPSGDGLRVPRSVPTWWWCYHVLNHRHYQYGRSWH